MGPMEPPYKSGQSNHRVLSKIASPALVRVIASLSDALLMAAVTCLLIVTISAGREPRLPSVIPPAGREG
jgi:hypothetical protein